MASNLFLTPLLMMLVKVFIAVLLLPVRGFPYNLKLPRPGHLRTFHKDSILARPATGLDSPVDLLESVETNVDFMLPSSPRNSWRNVIGVQALLVGGFGIVTPLKILELLHMSLKPDGTLMLFKSMSITTFVLGGCMMHSNEDLAVMTGALYFSGLTCLLVTAIDQNIISGFFVETFAFWQAIMAATLVYRTFLHRERLWKKLRDSMQRYPGGVNEYLQLLIFKLFNGKMLRHIFMLQNILLAQCVVFGATALFFPGFFFKDIFFMLNTPASSSMIIFAQGLALSSLVLALLVRNRTNKDASKIGVVYFGSLALHSLLTCGNPISPVFAPIDTILTFRSIQECKGASNGEKYSS